MSAILHGGVALILWLLALCAYAAGAQTSVVGFFILGGVLEAIAYAVLFRRTSVPTMCPFCKKRLPADAVYCARCAGPNT